MGYLLFSMIGELISTEKPNIVLIQSDPIKLSYNLDYTSNTFEK